MAVSFIVGGAFGSVVKSSINDILMPPIGLLLDGVEFGNFFILLTAGSPAAPNGSLSDAQSQGQ